MTTFLTELIQAEDLPGEPAVENAHRIGPKPSRHADRPLDREDAEVPNQTSNHTAVKEKRSYELSWDEGKVLSRHDRRNVQKDSPVQSYQNAPT